jgi:mono/diheme cytochrome c family protein
MMLVFSTPGSDEVMRFSLCSILFPVLYLSASLREAAAAVDFEKEILPILEENCFDCHGPSKVKSGFRADQRALMLKGGDSGIAALVPGDPEGSYLIEVVKGEKDPDMRMPPKGEPLTSTQIALLERWIREGAEWPGQMDAVADTSTQHWSFLPVTRPEIPQLARHPVDAFLKARLSESKLAMNGPAAPADLIRRLSIVLTGLPPTPERVAEFAEASQTNTDAAYSALVDELLASPHFGERWAQHWLDVIRWAETNGSEANLYRKNAWIYRDYVVRAFNEDLPYDRFIQEQIAGDQLGAGEATGFLVAGPHVPAATVGQEPSAIRQARADRMDEIIQTVGASVLGVTVGCARCHNHKFDPVTIQDYYAMAAVFQGVEFGGRFPELDSEHPRRQRAGELYAEMSKQRAVLRKGIKQWVEDWGGFKELQFEAATTRALRIDFASLAVSVDELEVFGPGDQRHNLALADHGAELKTDESMIQLRGELFKANDGEFGTQAWRAKAAKDSKDKPWVEIHFPQAAEVSRFRFSSNREYFFETDYLEGGGGNKLPDFKVSALQEDGSWKVVGGSLAMAQALAAKPELKAASDRLHELIGLLQEQGPRHSFIARFQKPTVTRVLSRGSPETPREEVVPAGFAILNGDLGLDGRAPDAERRLKFSEWLVQPDHPLTARVMVNRLWHHLFGTGIVPTTADFGFAGAVPSHPELLDWLAAELVKPTVGEAAPWSMKGMIRLLVTSDAFCQSSAPREDGLAADAGAALLWRFPPRRVEAEVIRDGTLQASGKLDRTLGGRSFRIHNEKKTYAQWQVIDNHGPETWRRMIYQERMRRVDDQIFTAFDFPDCGQVRDKRPVSTTPLQALNLMNSPFVVEQSAFVAERARKEAADPAGAVRRAFELLLNRPPSADELAACEHTDLALVCRSLINSNEFAFLP